MKEFYIPFPEEIRTIAVPAPASAPDRKKYRASLKIAEKMGIEKLLVTCDVNNKASEKTILANGGVYESTVYEPNEKEYLKRFWIEL